MGANEKPTFTRLHSFSTNDNTRWHLASLVPNSQNQFLIIDHDHNLLLTKTNGDIVTLFNGKQQFQHLVKFNALTLHPSFPFPEQHGAYTFYTAHIEISDKEQSRSRLPFKSQSSAPFDNVVTEWQLASTDSGYELLIDSKRELIRIPTPNIEAGIQQLSFNPFIKNWQKHFGLLFITLPAQPGFEQHPIYSGSLLRINPASFGLRAYTVPADNPFTLNDNIHPEVAAMGLGQAKRIHWLKEEVNQFAIDRGKQTSLAKLGADWRTNNRKTRKSVEISDYSNMLYFRNSALHNDMLPFLFLRKKNNGWTLSALSLAAMSLPNEIIKIPNNVLPVNAQPYLFKTPEGQLLLLELKSKSLFSLTGLNITAIVDSQEELTPTQASNSSDSVFIVIILIGLACAGFVFWRNQKHFKGSKKLLNRHYARFEIDDDNNSLHLFHRHQETAEKSINFNDVIHCEIALNDMVLAYVDNKTPFSNDIEKKINEAFKEEKRHKMIDNKVRKVSMVLTDSDKKTYSLCLYLREGNQRLTKLRFEHVQVQVIDWLWQLSNILAPTATEKRLIQEAQVRPISKAKKPKAPTIKPSVGVENNEKVTTVTKTPSTPTTDTKPKSNQSSKQTDEQLINALNKLLELKAQGFLTEEEFANSKAKVLSQFNKE